MPADTASATKSAFPPPHGFPHPPLPRAAVAANRGFVDDALGYTSNDRPNMEHAEANAATKAMQQSTTVTVAAPQCTAYSDFAAAAERTYAVVPHTKSATFSYPL